MIDAPESVLIVCNFPANTGYAWDRIERLFASLADRFAERGVRTLVAYPEIAEPPRTLEGSAAEPVLLDASLEGLPSLRATAELVRRENVRVLYLTDRYARHWAYPLLRRAGVRHIVVHDRISGERTPPRGPRRLAKGALNAVPGMLADVVIAVSDYVARRQVQVGLVPQERVVRVWNGHPVPRLNGTPPGAARARLGVDPRRPLVTCAGRASAEKGLSHLLRAFDRALHDGAAASGAQPLLVFLGDGPQLPELRRLREALAAREQILLPGYVRDAAALVREADLCVVPSTWQDAFPNAVLEAMARGKAVIGTRVGGIPEMLEHGVTGWLVPPGDEAALAEALTRLLADRELALRLGRQARERVAERFTPEEQLRRIADVLSAGLAPAGPGA